MIYIHRSLAIVKWSMSPSIDMSVRTETTRKPQQNLCIPASCREPRDLTQVLGKLCKYANNHIFNAFELVLC